MALMPRKSVMKRHLSLAYEAALSGPVLGIVILYNNHSLTDCLLYGLGFGLFIFLLSLTVSLIWYLVGRIRGSSLSKL
jgi:hypothetical protein